MAEGIEKILEKELKSDSFSPCYLLYGEDKYTLKRAGKVFFSAAEKLPMPDFNLNRFSSDAGIDAIADAALSLPFFADRKFVIVNDLDVTNLSSSENSKLEELIKDLSESTILVFYYPTLEFSNRKGADSFNKFLKLAEKYGKVYHFAAPGDNEIGKILVETAERCGSKISEYTAGVLIRDYIGKDINRLIAEVEKLSAFCEGREITRQDIDNLTAKSLEAKIFDLQKKIFAADYDGAYKNLYSLLEFNEEPIAILNILSDAYTDVYRVKAALKAGLKAVSVQEYDEAYKRKTFVLENAEKNGYGLSDSQLRKSITALLEADRLIKSSKISDEIILSELIGKLLLITKGEGKGWKKAR